MREAGNLFPKYGDYQEVRKQALKLAFWPSGEQRVGQVGDLNWEEIAGMAAPKACELRIDEVIGGFNNLRVIFYVFSKSIVLPNDAMPRLWTIAILQKKTPRWSDNDLRTFRARVVILRQRKYANYLN
jgi:hypothetical protein